MKFDKFNVHLKLNKNDVLCSSSFQAWRNWKEGTALNVVDPLLRLGSTSELMRCIHIALLCVQENEARRPTMNTVVIMLNSDSLSLPTPSEPAFLHSYVGTDMSAADSRVTNEIEHPRSEYTQASTNQISITELYPR